MVENAHMLIIYERSVRFGYMYRQYVKGLRWNDDDDMISFHCVQTNTKLRVFRWLIIETLVSRDQFRAVIFLQNS